MFSYYLFIAQFLNIIAIILSSEDPSMINTVVNAVIVGYFSLGGLFTNNKKKKKDIKVN